MVVGWTSSEFQHRAFTVIFVESEPRCNSSGRNDHVQIGLKHDPSPTSQLYSFIFAVLPYPAIGPLTDPMGGDVFARATVRFTAVFNASSDSPLIWW